MNYYEHHIGDYAEATAHLSFVEDAAYSRLIRKYYSTEKPIPADIKAAQRLVAARTREERAAVEAVLQEFFVLREDGWHQLRCDEELDQYQAGEPERDAKRANKDARLKRHRLVRAAMFEALRAKGQHPPWNISIEQLRRLLQAAGIDPETVAGALHETLPRTQTATAPATPATATQTPDTRHQSPVPQTPDTRTVIGEVKAVGKPTRAPKPPGKEPARQPERPDDVAEQVWDDWVQHRAKKRATVTATVVEGARAEALKAGMPLEAFLRVWCTRGTQGLQAEWLTPEERSGAPPPRRQTATDRNVATLAALTGANRRTAHDERPEPPLADIVDVAARAVG